MTQELDVAAVATAESAWNLLLLSTASLTITVTILLWFLTDLFNQISKAELHELRDEQVALMRSIRVPIIVTAVVLIIGAGTLSAIVAWGNSAVIGIGRGSEEFLLLTFSLLLPVVGATVAGLLLLHRVGVDNVSIAFSTFVSRVRARPISFAIPPIATSGETPVIAVAAHVLQEWFGMQAWVSDNEMNWGLGRKFIASNQTALASIVEDVIRSSPQTHTNINLLVHLVADRVATALRDAGRTEATRFGRPTIISKAACALFFNRQEGPH